MLTILGAGGAIGNELVRLLALRKQPFRLVGRNPRMVPGAAEVHPADLSIKEQTIQAVSGSAVVFLLAGLKIRSQDLGRNLASHHGKHD